MPWFIGVTLALVVSLFARMVGLDRDRAFYPTVMIVIAGLYGLFAAISGSPRVLAFESFGIVGFIALAVIGFRYNLWWVVAALVGHGVYDGVHHHLFSNPGVPVFWPSFCLAYDVTAGGVLASILWRNPEKCKVF